MNRYIAILPGAWAEGPFVKDALDAATAKLGGRSPKAARVWLVGPTCTVKDGELAWAPHDMAPVLAYASDSGK